MAILTHKPLSLAPFGVVEGSVHAEALLEAEKSRGTSGLGEAVGVRWVVKRDGRRVSWDRSRIVRALGLAYAHAPDWKDPLSAGERRLAVERLAEGVEWAVGHRFRGQEAVAIEAIQDVAETCLAAAGDWPVARAYVRYRTQRAERRPRTYAENGLQDFIAVSKYARFRPEWGRREVWVESVRRVRDMHLRHFASQAAERPAVGLVADRVASLGLPEALAAQLREQEGAKGGPGRTLFEEIWEAFAAVEARQVLPSMRSLQFGGAAIEANQARMYNCSFSHADRVSFFRECFFLLLSGVGVGFSVQRHHVAALPALPRRAAESDLPVRHLTIGDSIEGWAEALDALVRSHYEGWLAEFSYAAIRPRGAELKTSGGRAPGHLPLKRTLGDIDRLLSAAAGRHLRPIEVYDLTMLIARAVLSGGIRRSATICLFSPDDDEMANAKTGNWFETHPHRAYSNNSALIVRSEADRATFESLFRRVRDSGEPGFYFAADREHGANPCVEIGLCPTAVVTVEDIAELRKLGFDGPLEPGGRVSGWQMCNLSTINGAVVTSPQDFWRACRQAALLGTLQAAYTQIPFLGPVTQWLNQREALLGVSICGILDRPEVLLNADVLRIGAAVVRLANAQFAALLGLRPAARTTCVKPEGTASLLLSAGSGIHPHHAPRYFRRVQVNRADPVYRHFRQANAHLTEPSLYSPEIDDVITFPVQAPDGALCRDDLDALTFLQQVLVVQENWVEGGLAHEHHNPGLRHNVSNTVTVTESEWEPVADFIWHHRARFTGVALLAAIGDKTYRQAPREALTTPEDVARWNSLEYQPVDYRHLQEKTDLTTLAATPACAGGTCEI